MYEDFIKAIRGKNKIKLTFYSKEDNDILKRTCAPMDYGPSRRAHDKSNRYHLWDYGSDQERHTLSLLPEQVVGIEVLEETFEPAEFITWDADWFIERDWGIYS